MNADHVDTDAEPADRETPWAGLPALPTSSLPGTLSRQRVYAQRAAEGTELHHPYDATESDPLAPRRWHTLTDAAKKEVARKACAEALSEYVSPYFG